MEKRDKRDKSKIHEMNQNVAKWACKCQTIFIDSFNKKAIESFDK